jgi:outer membrane scaffolding protein for murein synthesis (MipA/OmpV family)
MSVIGCGVYAFSRLCAALCLVLGFFSLIGPAALAQGILYTPQQSPAPWDINVGVGAAMRPTFPGSDRYRITPVPLVIIRWRDTISLGANGLSIYWHHDNFRVGSGVSYDGGRLDHETSGLFDSGDNRLTGLGDIGASVGIRAFISYKVGPVYLDTSAIKYIGPDNKGVLINLGASAPLMLTKRLVLRPHIRATWADNNYMSTYFGITAIQSSQSIFPQFSAGAGVEDINAGLSIVYLLNKHWFIGADASATRFLGDAARSPITIANTNAIVAAAVGYHF